MKPFFLFIILLSGIYADAQSPRFNEVFQGATHNTYWVKRAAAHELFASGTQERLLDQLLFDHVRTLEIDIHKMHRHKGQWAIYHTAKRKNSFFATLPDFLKQLQQFHYSMPQHEVVTVIFELKQILGKNFDDTHTPADLDSILQNYFGDMIFRPSDLMKHCPHDTTLCDCVASAPDVWPTIEQLRGKFVFVVLGNLHVSIIGHGGQGWATYANSPNPVAFPMSSDFSVFNDKKGKGEKVSADILKHAYDASVFQQVENVNDTAHLAQIRKFIARGGIVRGASSFSIAEQQQRINAGFNMLQTDYPWLQYRDKGFSQPFRPKDISRFPDTTVFSEPGTRIFLSPAKDSFWMQETSEGMSDWETLPSSTRHTPDPKFPDQYRPYGKGCIHAESTDGQSSISVCRKVDSRQNAVISVEVRQKNKTTSLSFKTKDRTCRQSGDMIRLVLERDGENAMIARAYSSCSTTSSKYGDFKPIWNELLSSHFDQILIRQGLMAHDGDVLFVGTKRNGFYE